MASQTFQLVMGTGPTPNKSFTLAKQEIVIGRDHNEDIVINVAEISRRHTRLSLESKGYMVEDLGSTNGTFVNGNRLSEPQLLLPGDSIQLGEAVTLIYQSTQFDPDNTIVSPMEQQTVTISPPTPIPDPDPLAPAYAVEVPASPAPATPSHEEKRSRPWLWASIGCLGIFICLLAVGAYAFDSLNLYCNPPFDSLFTIFYPCP